MQDFRGLFTPSSTLEVEGREEFETMIDLTKTSLEQQLATGTGTATDFVSAYVSLHDTQSAGPYACHM